MDRPLRIVHLVSPRSANAEEVEASEGSALTVDCELAGDLQCAAPAIRTVAAVIFKGYAHLPGALELQGEIGFGHFPDLDDNASTGEGEGVDTAFHVINSDAAVEALADGTSHLQDRSLPGGGGKELPPLLLGEP